MVEELQDEVDQVRKEAREKVREKEEALDKVRKENQKALDKVKEKDMRIKELEERLSLLENGAG